MRTIKAFKVKSKQPRFKKHVFVKLTLSLVFDLKNKFIQTKNTSNFDGRDLTLVAYKISVLLLLLPYSERGIYYALLACSEAAAVVF